MDSRNSVFTAKDEKGKMTTYEIIFTFDSEDTKKSYIVYTDHTKEKGKMKVYANIYDKTGRSKDLLPIETEEEWNTIEVFLSKLEDEVHEEN